nr:uncharacterized protein LOC9268356 [Oryza sativa Japonica Group]XP_015626931.1 uncharacterized protein LOC9268356 [Oryza sativa Japonica Group]
MKFTCLVEFPFRGNIRSQWSCYPRCSSYAVYDDINIVLHMTAVHDEEESLVNLVHPFSCVFSTDEKGISHSSRAKNPTSRTLAVQGGHGSGLGLHFPWTFEQSSVQLLLPRQNSCIETVPDGTKDEVIPLCSEHLTVVTLL